MLKHTVLFLCVALLTLLLNGNVRAAAVSKHDLEYVQQQVKEESLRHQELQKQAERLKNELSQVSQLLVKKARQIQNIEDKTSQMENQLLQLQKELQDAENEFSKEDKNLIQTTYALQNLALKPTESLFVQPLTPVEIIRSAMLLREAVPYLAEQAANIRKKLKNISDKKENIERQIAKIAQGKDALEKEHEQLRKLVKQKSDMQQKVQNKSIATKQKIKQLADQAKDIKELLDKLDREKKSLLEFEKIRREKEQKERAELEEYRRQQEAGSSKTSEHLIKTNTEFIKETGRAFSKARGKLSKPARGNIITVYGEETSKGVTSKGIYIKTRPLAQVISPYDGAVIFSGPFRGYGKLIIIEHGEGYMSLLAGMETVDCDVGQMLLAGEPIGQMPGEDDAKLYVELRKNNKPIDPQAWIEK